MAVVSGRAGLFGVVSWLLSFLHDTNAEKSKKA
jgi:hypothetical protein